MNSQRMVGVVLLVVGVGVLGSAGDFVALGASTVTNAGTTTPMLPGITAPTSASSGWWAPP